MIIQIESSKRRVTVVFGRSQVVDEDGSFERVSLGGEFDPAGSEDEPGESGSCGEPLDLGFSTRGAV